ncbi:MAG TPA: glucose-6-phosphate dehydrogenase (NADP(+)) [Longimicrobiales bacterium]|nr:glucose-6-phosphate dehydrogenase (NADP(+)) [Longimicrobiales bacterium]
MKPEQSDAFVLFGATGDLAHKKIFPALRNLIHAGRLDMPVIGVARNEGDVQLDTPVQYVTGDYRTHETFIKLREALGDARHPLFYLAIPPAMFASVAEGLGKTGCSQGARIIVEKPFGRSLASAQELNEQLLEVFDESQIFRIDHYLGKESVQNLLVFRFANSFLEPAWNAHHIESVRITMSEKFGVEGRGAFYEEAGAIRDVVQNHLLEVVTYLAMEPPISTGSEDVSRRQLDVLRSIRPLDPSNVVRGQARGYRAEKNVAPESTVETFAALRMQIDSPRWRGAPFIIRAGKFLNETKTEVLVTLKEAPLPRLADGSQNCLRFRLTPDVAITIEARIKKGGERLTSEPAELSLVDSTPGDDLDAYTRLLGDAIIGERMLFAHEEFVEAAWAIVDPILGDAAPLYFYEPGTTGPQEADRL